MKQNETKVVDFSLSEEGIRIPKGWSYSTLNDLRVELIDCVHDTPRAQSKGFIYIAIPQMKEGRLLESGARLISKEDFEKWTTKANPQKGDLVVSRRCNPGESAYVTGQFPFALGQNLVILRSNGEKLMPEYLKWISFSKQWKDQVSKYLNVGAVFESLKCSEIPLFRFIVPPLHEQKAIAVVLGCLDDKIELLREQNETLETLAQTLFKQWFIDFNFPDENGNPYKDSGGKMIPSELGEIPEGWKTDKIDEYVSISGGGTPSTKEPAYWDGDIAWSSPKDLSDRPDAYLFKTNKMITDQGLNSISSKLNPIGSLLLSSRAPIGYVAINDIPIAVNQGYIVFAPHQYLSNQFMFLWLKKYMHLVNNAANGSTFLEISKKAFKEIETIIPDQMALSTFQDLIEPVFDKLKSNLKQVQTLTQLRDALLPKLMKGEIRVPVEA